MTCITMQSMVIWCMWGNITIHIHNKFMHVKQALSLYEMMRRFTKIEWIYVLLRWGQIHFWINWQTLTTSAAIVVYYSSRCEDEWAGPLATTSPSLSLPINLFSSPGQLSDWWTLHTHSVPSHKAVHMPSLQEPGPDRGPIRLDTQLKEFWANVMKRAG